MFFQHLGMATPAGEAINFVADYRAALAAPVSWDGDVVRYRPLQTIAAPRSPPLRLTRTCARLDTPLQQVDRAVHRAADAAFEVLHDVDIEAELPQLLAERYLCVRLQPRLPALARVGARMA